MKGKLARFKRVAGITIVAVLLMQSLAACGTPSKSSGGASPSSDSAATPSPVKEKLVKLNFLFPQYDEKTQGLMQQVVDEFNKENDGKINVALEITPWDKIYDKLITQMGANQTPDIFGYATRWLAQFTSLGQIENLNTYLTPDFKQRFIQTLLDSAKLPGDSATYGIPVAASSRMLFYRKDLFDKANIQPPKTWDELAAAGTKINNPPNLYGLGLYANGIEVDSYFDYFLWNNGGDILDANGKAILNSPQGVEALQFMVDLANKHKVTQPNPNGFGRDQIIQMFISGQLGMYPTGPWLSDEIKRQSPDLKYGISYFPSKTGSQPAVLGITDSLGISSHSEHKAEAWKFVQFMYQTKYRLEFDKIEGMLPELVEVMEDPYFQSPDKKPFVEALNFAKFYPPVETFPTIEQIQTVAVQDAMAGKKTPKQALDEAAQKIDALAKK
ncbi:MAG: sugar ABC transporter substrate-binding protein [Paenibacillaceae bacterium]